MGSLPLILKSPLPFTTFILDLNDVLCFRSAKDLDGSPVPPPFLRLLVDSSDWHKYERGSCTRETCYEHLADKFQLEQRDLWWALRTWNNTATYNRKLLEAIAELKEAAAAAATTTNKGGPGSPNTDTAGRLRVLLAANVAGEDWEEHLKDEVGGWDVFDQVFLSCYVGARKPTKAFWRRVLDGATGGIRSRSPAEIVCVDARPEHCVAARLWGMHAIQLGNDLGNDPTDQVVARLCEIFGDPAARGEAWLREHAREMWSTTSTGVLLKEQYSQLLLKEITTDCLHTTVLGLYNVHHPIDPAYHTLDQMLMYIRDDGLFYTYFDKNRRRIDPIVSANILHTFYTCWRGDQVRPTLDAMLALVQTRAYDFAMRYHMHPDWFFYYLSDLCLRHPWADELADLRRLLRERLVERFGSGGGNCRVQPARRVLVRGALGLSIRERGLARERGARDGVCCQGAGARKGQSGDALEEQLGATAQDAGDRTGYCR
ncbi:HAD-like protein [Apiospora arundinis]|uniref:HAD-like protein n=1 Tax=Apiospora arundinis TaxID=335852 RepID=A0ABR2HPM4_9PEZI